MNARARELIQLLRLERHPEGGYYREVFRSTREVRVPAPAVEGEPSGWHSVASDEIWHHLEGAPAELVELSIATSSHIRHRLGPLGDGAAPVTTIPAGHWQTARTLRASGSRRTGTGVRAGPHAPFRRTHP